MTRDMLDRKIRLLLDEIGQMHQMVETATRQSVDALCRNDVDLARRVYEGDRDINAWRFRLENDCMITIATQQPIMAGDLRRVASILEVVAELERMGDYAKGIARICLMIGDHPLVKPLIDIPNMADISLDLLRRAVKAFLTLDVDEARRIPTEDDQVDSLYKHVYRDMVEIMLKDPSVIDQANHLLWVAHNLERMADRVTNICERTIYVATGELTELEHQDTP
jgi:phosphate transport system protein